jgi:tRNA(fMet)-specific endonuclease VapC
MLDTNAVSAFLNRLSPRLDGWVREQRCCLSAIVVAEIRFGLEKRPAAVRLKALAEATLETLEILPWTEACARTYGRLRADLEHTTASLWQ